MSLYLVTGGAGFIGTHVVRVLRRRGHRVRVLDNLSAGKKENLSMIPGVDFQLGDIRNRTVVTRATRGVDYVIHLAAIRPVEQSVADPLLVNAVNIGGTVQVLWAARQAGVKRVVLASSSAVSGASDRRPTSPYGVAKLADEHYARVFSELYGLSTVSLRYFNVYGPHQDWRSPYSLVIPLFLKDLLAGRRPTIDWDGRQARDFVYIDDVVRATIAAATSRRVTAGADYDVGSGQATTIAALCTHLQHLLGTNLKPRRRQRRPGDVRRTKADIRATQRALKWQPVVSLADGLQRSVEWYKLHLYENTVTSRKP